jgi:hypothetical protein
LSLAFAIQSVSQLDGSATKEEEGF